MIQMVDIAEDLATSVDNMIRGAIAVTTGRLHLDDPDEALARVVAGDPAATNFFRHELAQQVATLLLRLDDNVRAVYVEEDLPECEEMGDSMLALSDPINLVVYSNRETAALSSLVKALDLALAAGIFRVCKGVTPGVLSVETVDEVRVGRFLARANSFRPQPSLLASRDISPHG